MSTSHPLVLMHYLGPAVGALAFVLLMSRVPEPTGRTWNAILVAGACGAYLNGGFGPWELLYPVLALPVAFRGLQSYRFTGIAWLMHAAWDLPHHLWGNPIWPFMRTSSLGCAIFDTLISIWFLAGAPKLIRRGLPEVKEFWSHPRNLECFSSVFSVARRPRKTRPNEGPVRSPGGEVTSLHGGRNPNS